MADAAQPPELSISPSLKNDTNSVYTKAQRIAEHKAKLVRLGRRLSSSLSAQDLRYFEMEREKEDVRSPRGVLEACIGGLDNESDSLKSDEPVSEIPSSNSRAISHFHSSKAGSRSRWPEFFKLWKKGSVRRLPSIPRLGVRNILRRKSASLREEIDPDICHKSSWKTFTLSDLEVATNNFSCDNLIGRGGYAEVYRGSLPDGQLVAIKRLNQGSPEEQTISFLSEIGIIAHVNHPNTAKMIGYGVEGGTFLVLELSSLGSLGSLLHGSKEKLDWGVRYKIILGTADGLLYLHENCQRRIIHRDIKADNILLTEGFEPQICDFGLAKWLPEQWTHHYVPKFEGTFGYFAPEYFLHGIVDEKTDVFSFGVLLLELITGRRALDESQQSLVLSVKPLLDNNDVEELVDPSLGDKFNPEEMGCVILTASLCIEQAPFLRPRMSEVIQLLRGDVSNVGCKKEHQKRFLQRTYSEELLDAEEYNSTKFLKDLNRHKQVALGA